mmetsp:Transcript_26431/g.43289  ORF Transcript_26431/g.43289 Transcript_26431/m.43289 type:complete len:104 (+) Transcript_26431:52-363(+)
MVDELNRLLTEEELRAVARELKDSRVTVGHPGKGEDKNISWDDLQKVFQEYPDSQVRPQLLRICAIVKKFFEQISEKQLERPFQLWQLPASDRSRIVQKATSG